MSISSINAATQKYRIGSREYDFAARSFIMGVLNVTPDSFSDGGRYFDVGKAVDRALEMIDEGADFIDIGGESSRPGSDPIPADEEIKRTIPVIERLVGKGRVPISIDTSKAAVARVALEAGATIVNDISAMTFDEEMADVVSSHKATVVLMHMKGTPKTMQVNPSYTDVVAEVVEFLRKRIEFARARGIDQVIVDPGIGFGKTLEHNLRLIKELDALRSLDVPILVGTSRKSFIGTILGLPVEERLEGTAAAVAASILNGAHIVRVHDVKAMKRVAAVADAICRVS
ncbi:MAG TPA: dihydropteroate synthase [Bacteroidota bacterium]|nr:dihydropteroate synthase [Bacteroidota bacterium]